MGDWKAPIAAIAAALFAFLLGVPAAVGAVGPIDAASPMQTVQQRADTVTGPAAQQAAAVAQGAVRQALERAAGRASDTARPPAGTSDRVPPSRTAGQAAAVRRAPVIRAPIARDRGFARTGTSRRVNPTSPPHGRKVTPAARSIPERARAAHPAPPAAAGPPAPRRAPGEIPGGKDTANGAAGFPASAGFVVAAFLIAALGAARLFLLRRLQLPARRWRRLAFVSPGVPPG